MADIFSTTGMTTVTTMVFSVELLSFVLMGIILLAFHRVRRKQENFFKSLHNAPVTLSHYNVLVWSYVLLTLIICTVTTLLFIFQPHIL